LSALEELANSKADHGLVPLGGGGGYVPVLSAATTAMIATTYTAVVAQMAADAAGGTALVGDVPSARIPVRGSAEELLSVRSGSIG
jgi:hypothetical protein